MSNISHFIRPQTKHIKDFLSSKSYETNWQSDILLRLIAKCYAGATVNEVFHELGILQDKYFEYTVKRSNPWYDEVLEFLNTLETELKRISMQTRN